MLKVIRKFWKGAPARAAANRDLTDFDRASLLVTHAEVSLRHGTGALLKNIFQEEEQLLICHSRKFFERNEIGDHSLHVEHPAGTLGSARKEIRAQLSGAKIRRILSVPFYPDDVLSTLAAAQIFDAPIALYMMDDQNIHVQEISDDLMSALVAQANIRFAISEPLCRAYSEKFKTKFWIIPPVANPALFAPSGLARFERQSPRGALIGNVWSLDMLNSFRATVRASGLSVDWFGNAGKPFIVLDPLELESEGIYLRSMLRDPELVGELRNADFAIVPSGTLEKGSSHNWLAKSSLPSRIIYLMATANIPIIVLGHEETAAAKFVRKLDLGTSCPYDSDALQEAVQQVTSRSRFNEIRAHANQLSAAFSSHGLADFIWRSLEIGEPIDDRFERIFG
jgi:hypothetical protein